MSQVIRKANSGDLDSIYLMGFDVWSNGNAEENYLNECRSSPKYKRGTWFVLEENEKLLSSLIIYQLKVNSVGIGSISTPQMIRNRGYASNLISKVIAKFENETQQPVFFLYSDINPEFYERFGFKRLPEGVQRYKTTICMVRGAAPEEFASSDETPEYF